jgi:hypothetical protein
VFSLANARIPDQPAVPLAYRSIRHRKSGYSVVGMNDASWPQYSNSSRRSYAIVSRIGAGYGPSREKRGRYWVRTRTLTESIWSRPIRPSTRRIKRASTAPPGGRSAKPWAASAMRRASAAERSNPFTPATSRLHQNIRSSEKGTVLWVT